MKKVWKWLAGAAFVMIGLPFLAVKCVPGDAGMAVCFVLFFAVNPLFSMLAGWAAVVDGKMVWWVPLAVSGLFLVGVWAFFDPGERAFWRYAEAYLCAGCMSMCISWLARKK